MGHRVPQTIKGNYSGSASATFKLSPHAEWINAFKAFEESRELSREIVCSLVEKIELDSDKSITITLKYQSEYLETASVLERWAANAHE